ncbi:MAG: hypothetical protein WKG01_10850 [Kofleriaceae bacterium]
MNASHCRTYGPAVFALLIASACTKSEDATPLPSAREQAQVVQNALALPPSAPPTPIQPAGDAMQVVTPKTARSSPEPASVGTSSPVVRMLGLPPAATSTSKPLPHGGAAPHLFHLGADSFFLDHEELTPTGEQRSMLSAIRETAVLGYATTQRKIDQAEQELWAITSAEHPSASGVEAKLAEIARLSTRQRMDYILAIGKAVAHLTDAQKKMLAMPPMSAGSVSPPGAMGSGTSAPPPMPPAPPAASGSSVDPTPMPVEPPPGMPMGANGSAKPMGHM